MSEMQKPKILNTAQQLMAGRIFGASDRTEPKKADLHSLGLDFAKEDE